MTTSVGRRSLLRIVQFVLAVQGFGCVAVDGPLGGRVPTVGFVRLNVGSQSIQISTVNTTGGPITVRANTSVPVIAQVLDPDGALDDRFIVGPYQCTFAVSASTASFAPAGAGAFEGLLSTGNGSSLTLIVTLRDASSQKVIFGPSSVSIQVLP